MKKKFYLYKRQLKKGYIYYVQYVDEYGILLPGRSTGQTSKAAAEAWANTQLQKGLISSEKNVAFSVYAKDWWIWDTCDYVRYKLAMRRKLSRRYIDEMRRLLLNHILPFFGKYKVSNITRELIKRWIIVMDNKMGRNGTLSPSTINQSITCLRIMLDWALENGYIKGNPIAKNLRIDEITQERGIMTLEEVKQLFSDEAISIIWQGNLRNYVASLLSVSTGMREGEILGLQRGNIFENHILIMHSWSKSYGLTEPKWGGVRPVPIPIKTSKYLHGYIEQSPYQESKDLVFHGREPNRPIDDKTLIRAFYRALEKMGVSDEERKKRNITFHSMRHTFNSIMRGKIHDSKLTRITGHRTDRMLEYYTHFSIDDFKDVLNIQDQLF